MNHSGQLKQLSVPETRMPSGNTMITFSPTKMVRTRGAFSKDNLKGFAATMGLDTKAFNTCLDSGKYTQFVQDQTNKARELGVQSTPTFAVNGQGVTGAQSFDTFQKIIEGILNPVTPNPITPTP